MASGEQLQSLKIDQLIESRTNPRSTFDKAGLAELADSIRLSGILQPIVARPHNGKFEIVVGARRFRAARLANLDLVPAIVREMDDAEAMEIQLLENLQREDLSPLDEGLGYRALIEKAKYDVAKVAEKIGKSQSYVYQRLKLADLSKPAQKALTEGKINAGHAVQIARLQPEAQAKAVQACDGSRHNQPLTVRELGSWIQTEIHRNLDKAPWKKDDGFLLPSAGACTICLKRAGTNPKLFPDLKPQTCTDATCYQSKTQVFIALRLEEFPGAVRILAGHMYALDVDDRDAVREKKDVVPMSEYGGEGWKPSTAGACEFTKDGVIVLGETALLGQHKLVCAEPKCPVHGTRRSSGGSVPNAPGAMNEERREQIEELWRRRERDALKRALHAALRKKQEKLSIMPIEALRFAVQKAFYRAQIYSDAHDYLEKVWGIKGSRSLFSGRLFAKADQITLLRLLLDFPLVQDVANKFADGKEIALAARAYKLPIPAITAAIHKEWAEKKRISYAKRDARLAAEKKSAAKKLEARSTMPAGEDGCRYCGCTEAMPCGTSEGPCAWLVKPKKKGKGFIFGVCSAPKCALTFQKDKRAEKRAALQTSAKKAKPGALAKPRKRQINRKAGKP
jgi:ParB family chromosome partitioning protein